MKPLSLQNKGRSWRSLAEATIFMALVIFLVLVTEIIRILTGTEVGSQKLFAGFMRAKRLSTLSLRHDGTATRRRKHLRISGLECDAL